MSMATGNPPLPSTPPGGGGIIGPGAGNTTINAVMAWGDVDGLTAINTPIIIDPTTGQMLVDSTDTIPLRVRMAGASGNPSLITNEDNIVRQISGYFGNSGFSTAPATPSQIGTSFNGGVVIASRGNFAGGGIKFYTPDSGFTALLERMSVSDLTGRLKIGTGAALGLLDVESCHRRWKL